MRLVVNKYKWIRGKSPNDFVVRQVYGIVFSDDGMVLLRIEDNEYKLTGGRPELGETFEETLIREYLEEINVEVYDIYYLGYLLVNSENENLPYAQVSMIARIKNIGGSKSDIDTGKTYLRFLSNIFHVKTYLNYRNEAGEKMIEDAINLAKTKYHFMNQNEKSILYKTKKIYRY